MNRFGYWRDPLFLAAVSGYGLNRWLIKPLGPPPFRHGYWADLLMIPAALPLVLWLQRLSGLRPHDQSPSGSEIALHLAGWSVICEFVGPQWGHHGTADGWDVVAYLWWNRSGPQVSRRTA